MNWWLLIPAVPVYLAVGLGLARMAFVRELEDSSRFQIDDCLPKHCIHVITIIDGQRHRRTRKHQDARNLGGWVLACWPAFVLLVIIAYPMIFVGGVLGRVLGQPTKAEKLTQRERDLVALSAKAKELGLPVPEEWGQDSGRNDDPYGDKAWIKAEVERRAKLRNPNRHREEHAA